MNKINKDTYKKMIEQDIEWLNEQPLTLERSHIISVLEDSVNLYCPKKEKSKKISKLPEPPKDRQVHISGASK